MRTQQKLLLLGGNRTPATWTSYVTGLAPVGWWSMRATSGTNEANRGSGGSALDMTITSATLGQTGKLGANEAFTFDGANSRLQTANNATLAALTTFEYVMLVKPASSGEGTVGCFFNWGKQTAEPAFLFSGSLNSATFRLSNTTPTNTDTVVSTPFVANTWVMVHLAFDNAGDRKGHIYKGVTGAVAEVSYSAQPAMTGTYKTPTSALNIGNASDQTETFDGLFDEFLIFNRVLTSGERTLLTQLAGV